MPGDRNSFSANLYRLRGNVELALIASDAASVFNRRLLSAELAPITNGASTAFSCTPRIALHFGFRAAVGI